jgi:hypothetical protein
VWEGRIQYIGRAYIVGGVILKKGRIHKEGAYIEGGDVLRGNTFLMVLVGQKVYLNDFLTMITESHWKTEVGYLDFGLPVEHGLKGLAVGLRSNPGGAAVRLSSRI